MFKRKKVSNLKQLLQKYMIWLITFVLGFTAIVFLTIEYRNIKSTAITDLENICTTTGDNIDLQIYQLDTITLNTINSSDLSSALTLYVKTADTDPYNHISARQRLAALLTSLKGFDYSVRQLNVYSTQNIGYGVGDYLGVLKDYDSTNWYKATTKANGLKYVSIGDLDKTGALTDGNTYFSISRTFFDVYHYQIGTIEARKYYDEVFSSALTDNSSYSSEIYVFDDEGKLVFPLDGDSKRGYELLSKASSPKVTIKSDNLFIDNYLFSYRMPHSKYTTIMYVDSSNFSRLLVPQLAMILLLFVLIYIAGLFASQIIAKNISNPIRKIYHFLLEKNSENQYEPLSMEPVGIREIDKLARSINEYITSSEAQTKTMLGLQQQEVQAEMLALQNQMNPHFLYNSLACIEEMAREGLTDSVATMVKDISSILRAISSNKNQVITLEEELDLCDMYLECLTYRFGKDLTYEFDVEDTLLDYMVPKLCIQLLVENAIKSTTASPLPWHICVKGYTEGENWFIEVIDNGPGFDKEVDTHLRKQMDSILETGVLPSLKIEGMGILNIFIRLYLLDGITFLFDFGNNVEGGAFVKIGRSIEKSKPILD